MGKLVLPSLTSAVKGAPTKVGAITIPSGGHATIRPVSNGHMVQVVGKNYNTVSETFVAKASDIKVK